MTNRNKTKTKTSKYPKPFHWLILFACTASIGLFFLFLFCLDKNLSIRDDLLEFLSALSGSLIIATIAYYGLYNANTSRLDEHYREEQLNLVKSINILILASQGLVLNLRQIQRNYQSYLLKPQKELNLESLPNIPINDVAISKTQLDEVSLGARVNIEKGINTNDSDTSLMTIFVRNEIATMHIFELWRERNRTHSGFYARLLKNAKLSDDGNVQVHYDYYVEDLEVHREDLRRMTKMAILATQNLIAQNLDLLNNVSDKLPMIVDEEYRHLLVDARISEDLKRKILLMYPQQEFNVKNINKFTITS